jgi:hypothetical protein
MACALPGIASAIGIDPTLPRDGTNFITLENTGPTLMRFSAEPTQALHLLLSAALNRIRCKRYVGRAIRFNTAA